MGGSIARIVGEAGAHVIAHYGTDRAGAEAALADLPPERKLLVQADLHDLAAAERLWDVAQAWRGRIDVFVNNAAILLWNGGVEGDDASWDAVLAETLPVNVLAPAPFLRR